MSSLLFNTVSGIFEENKTAGIENGRYCIKLYFVGNINAQQGSF